MKTKILYSIIFLLYVFTVFPVLSFANNPEWINYTNGNKITSFLMDKDTIWVGTKYGGLIRINSKTNETFFYNKANSGLPDNWVQSITIDVNGYKWIGTNDRGLVKFDGINWTVYVTTNSELPYNDINALAVDLTGIVWIGTSFQGITKFDGKNFINYSNYEMPRSRITSIAFDEIGIWIGTSDNGLFYFDGQDWKKYSMINANNINSIVIDKNGNKWIGTEKGLFTFGNYSLKNYDTRNSGLLDDIIRCIDIDDIGNIWVGTYNGLSKYDGNNWIQYNLDNSDIPDIDILVIKCVDKGNILVGTFNSGLAKFDGTNWTKFNTSNSGLKDNYFHLLTTDKNGNKWIITKDWESLLKFDGTNWTEYNFFNLELSDKAIRSIQIDKNDNLWLLAQADGLLKFDGTNWTKFNRTYLRGPLIIDGIGNKWAFNYKVLVKFDNTNWTEFKTPPNKFSVSAIAADSIGNIWCGTDGDGLWKFDGTNWTLYDKYNSSFPNKSITSIVIDGVGNLWLGTTNGIVKFDGINSISYKVSKEIPHYYVNALAIDKDNNIWNGTRDGLTKFDGTNWIVYNSTNSGLPASSVVSIAIDNYDNKWISTYESGLSVFREGGVVSIESEYQPKNVNTIIFPNPATDKITISNTPVGAVSYEIFDIFGCKILSTPSLRDTPQEGNWEIDVSRLLPGIYFLKLNNLPPVKFIKI